MAGSAGPHGPGRRARRGGAGVVCVALAVSAAACSGPAPASWPKGCYAGTIHLKVSPGTARPGDLVTVAAGGPWSGGNVTTQSYGLLGTAENGRFAATYNLAAIAPGVGREPNTPIGPSGAASGVGLPDRPFRIQVPAVPAGDYFVQFSYSVAPGATSSDGPKLYNLCTSLHVGS
jgi:hypothetical protein